MLHEDEILLSEFKKALRTNRGADVIDFDSSFKHKFDIQVHRFEDVLRDTNRAIPPNRWSYHRIGLIRKGTGQFITGIYKFEAKKNTLVVIPGRVITSSRNWSLDMEGYVVLFNMDYLLQNNFPRQFLENKKILTSSIQPYVQISDQQSEEIASIFETILKERKGNNANKSEFITLKIIELLINCERIFDEQYHFELNQPSIDIIAKFCELVENNFIEQRTVAFYADRLNVHPNYLNALVKKNIGITAKESIQNRLLIEVKYMLHSTQLSIKEIAIQLGFNDPNYFSSFFTRLEKTSPKNYRLSFV
jgi:AraC-like DNA-binding protein